MKRKTASFILSAVLCFSMAAPINADSIDISRIAGKNRYITSVEVSKKTYNTAKAVILASGEGFADALSGGQLSIAYNSPILLTRKNKLDTAVRNEISRLKPEEIFILGGEGSISGAVENELSGYRVTRLGGKNRYRTSEIIMKKAREKSGFKKVVIVSGKNYPDALAATGYMKKNRALMLLSSGNMPSTDLEAVAIGGSGSLPLNSFSGKRIAGKNRYETGLKIAQESFSSPDNVVVVSGENYPDALSSVSLLSNNDAPIILSASKKIDRNVLEYIRHSSKIEIVGGESSVGRQVENSIKYGNTSGNTAVSSDNSTKQENSSASPAVSSDNSTKYGNSSGSLASSSEKINMNGILSMNWNSSIGSKIEYRQSNEEGAYITEFFNKKSIQHDRDVLHGEFGEFAGFYLGIGISEANSGHDIPEGYNIELNADITSVGKVSKNGKIYNIFMMTPHEAYIDSGNAAIMKDYFKTEDEFSKILKSLGVSDGAVFEGNTSKLSVFSRIMEENYQQSLIEIEEL